MEIRSQKLRQTYLRESSYVVGHFNTCSNATNAVFRLERSTEVLELTYLGKYFACVNAN